MKQEIYDWAKKERMKRDYELLKVRSLANSFGKTAGVKFFRYCGTEEENKKFTNIVENPEGFWKVWIWIKTQYPELQLRVDKNRRLNCYEPNGNVIMLTRFTKWTLLHEFRHFLQEKVQCLGYDRAKYLSEGEKKIKSSKDLYTKFKNRHILKAEYDRIAEKDSESYAAKMLYTLGFISEEELEMCTRLVEKRFEGFYRPALVNAEFFRPIYESCFSKKRLELMGKAEEDLIVKLFIEGKDKKDIIQAVRNNRKKYSCPFGFDLFLSPTQIVNFVLQQ